MFDDYENIISNKKMWKNSGQLTNAKMQWENTKNWKRSKQKKWKCSAQVEKWKWNEQKMDGCENATSKKLMDEKMQ